MLATKFIVVSNIAPRPYTPRAPTASTGKCGISIVPISERGAFITSATAKAVARRIAPIALDKTVLQVGIDGPSPVGQRAYRKLLCECSRTGVAGSVLMF
jgi:hypothetical protein